jgi:transposase-like protein
MTEPERRIIKDRRSGADRRQRADWICDKCGIELTYRLPEKLVSNECYECKGCGQKYVVLKFKGRRDQIARVDSV